MSCEPDRTRNGYAIGTWENEGGAICREADPTQYGRRVEADRSWTVYDVFTGEPARADGRAMTGLSRAGATSSMLLLNGRTERHRASLAVGAMHTAIESPTMEA